MFVLFCVYCLLFGRILPAMRDAWINWNCLWSNRVSYGPMTMSAVHWGQLCTSQDSVRLWNTYSMSYRNSGPELRKRVFMYVMKQEHGFYICGVVCISWKKTFDMNLFNRRRTNLMLRPETQSYCSLAPLLDKKWVKRIGPSSLLYMQRSGKIMYCNLWQWWRVACYFDSAIICLEV